MTIEQRIAEIERQLAEVKAEMKPEPTGLIEAVDALVDSLITTKGYSNFDLEKVELALARERRIAEKREKVIKAVREWHEDDGNDDLRVVENLSNAWLNYNEECAK